MQILIIIGSIYIVSGPDLGTLGASFYLITLKLYDIYYYTYLKVRKLRHRALNNLPRVTHLVCSRVES